MLSPPMNLERRKDLQALIFLQAGRWNFYVMVSSWKSIAVGFLTTGSYGTTLPLSEYIIVDCRTAHPKEKHYGGVADKEDVERRSGDVHVEALKFSPVIATVHLLSQNGIFSKVACLDEREESSMVRMLANNSNDAKRSAAVRV